jgi:hypothetical protein
VTKTARAQLQPLLRQQHHHRGGGHRDRLRGDHDGRVRLRQAAPDELFEAARVDGANSYRGFIYLVIPLTRPITAAVLIFTLVAAWNDYLMPLVFLQSPNLERLGLDRVQLLHRHDPERITFDQATSPGGPVEVLVASLRWLDPR